MIMSRFRTIVLASSVSVAMIGVAFAVAFAAAVPQEPDVMPAVLTGEGMYSRASKEMWTHVQQMIDELGFDREKNDDRRQVIVTKWRDYDVAHFPDGSALGLAAGEVPARIQLHVAVSAQHEPARVAVGSIVEIRLTGSSGALAFKYRAPAVDGRLLQMLGKRAGVAHHAMPGAWSSRAALAAKLMPAGAADPCLASAGTVQKSAVTPPVKISEVKPLFPRTGAAASDQKVVITGWLTEHGTLANLQVVNPTERFAPFEASARAAAGLWRFEPAKAGGCPIITMYSITVNYTR